MSFGGTLSPSPVVAAIDLNRHGGSVNRPYLFVAAIVLNRRTNQTGPRRGEDQAGDR
jgi:hypothetical protein